MPRRLCMGHHGAKRPLRAHGGWSRLVGRVIPIFGLVGGPLILVSDTAAIFGLWGQTSAFGFLFGFPVIVFELSVGVYLTVKGFRPAAVAALDGPPVPAPDAVPAI